MSNSYAAKVARDQIDSEAGLYCTPRADTALLTEINQERAKKQLAPLSLPSEVSANVNEPEYTGGSVSYYRVEVPRPTSKGVHPYMAECNDIIEALQMNYAEGNAFKAIWRMCAARLGKSKKGYTDGLYDAEKVEFFGKRMVAQNQGEK